MANDKRILVVAGSDCSGGAGLEADQKVIAAFGCYAMTATTALTVQDTTGVHDVYQIPPAFVREQINACINDIGVDVVKIGMLASADTIIAVSEALEAHGRPITVVDPVMIATSGAQLLPSAAVKELRQRLLPLSTVLTPNIPEAMLLLENATGTRPTEPRHLNDLVLMARNVQSLGIKWVLLKGGHLPLTNEDVAAVKGINEDRRVMDILYGGDEFTFIHTPYIQSSSTHGTGCSLASAISCGLAQGYGVLEATHMACHYIEKGIQTAIPRGKGNGPINHFHTMPVLPSQ